MLHNWNIGLYKKTLFIAHSTPSFFFSSFLPNFSLFRRVSKIAKGDYLPSHVSLYLRPSVRLSITMEQLGTDGTDFHEIWYLSIFKKYIYRKNSRLTEI
jgi:hypothetical protein